MKLDEKEAESLIKNTEINPELPPRTLVFKIIQKAGKPLHFRDIEYVTVKKGFYQAHNKEIPKKPYLSLFHFLRNDSKICKISEGIYGLKEWKLNGLTNSSEEEVDDAIQSARQSTSVTSNSSEEFNTMKKNCPNCNGETDIKRHFCKHCGVDLFKFCNNCLSKIDDDAIFCTDCGTKLEQRIKKVPV